MLILALLLGAAPITDAGVVQRTSPEYRKCSPVVETEMDQLNCILPELQRQDNILRQATDATIRRLPPRRKAAFRRLQRDWSRHRSETCQRASRNAPNVFIAQTRCMLFETVRRTEWLGKHR